MEVALLVFAAVAAFATVPTALRELGVDVRVFGRAAMSDSEAIATRTSKARWWLVMIISSIALAGSLTGLYRIRQNQVVITPENAESYVRSWLDNFHMGTRRRDDPDAYFLLDVTVPSGNTVTIARVKNRASYITMGAGWILDADFKNRIQRLSDTQGNQVRSAVIIELARAGLNFDLNSLEAGQITGRIPITRDLTENMLIQKLMDVDRGLLIAEHTVRLNLERSQE